MTIEEFVKETEKEKMDLLQNESAYVGKRVIGDKLAMLFQLGGFYVEVIYRDYRKDIEDINVSAGLDLLKPYLDQVDVDWLRKIKNEK